MFLPIDIGYDDFGLGMDFMIGCKITLYTLHYIHTLCIRCCVNGRKFWDVSTFTIL